MYNLYKVIMIIDDDKKIVIKNNINCVLANKIKLFKETYENRENISYVIQQI